jgi:hypothetical protein
VQRSPTECGVSKCDREASTLRRLWPTRGCWPGGGEGLFGNTLKIIVINLPERPPHVAHRQL